MLIPQLTFTRFVAATIIIFFHFAAYNHVWPFDVAEFQWFTTIVKGGNLPVLYFFLLSGFILTINYPKDKPQVRLSDFYWRRFTRIYPIYFVSFLISLLFVANISFLYFILNLVLLNGWYWDSNILNPAAWSLSSEVFFYAVYPFLLMGIARLKIGPLLALAGVHILLLYLIQLPYGDFHFHHILPPPVETVLNFSLGVIAGRIYVIQYPFFDRNRAWLSFLFLPAIALLGILILGLGYTWFNGFWCFSPLFMVVIIAISSFPAHWAVTRILASPLLKKLGDISYSMFILQFPIMSLFNFLTNRAHLTLGNTSRFYGYLLFLIAVSFVTYTVIEDPARKKLNAFRKKKAASVAA